MAADSDSVALIPPSSLLLCALFAQFIAAQSGAIWRIGRSERNKVGKQGHFNQKQLQGRGEQAGGELGQKAI